MLYSLNGYPCTIFSELNNLDKTNIPWFYKYILCMWFSLLNESVLYGSLVHFTVDVNPNKTSVIPKSISVHASGVLNLWHLYSIHYNSFLFHNDGVRLYSLFYKHSVRVIIKFSYILGKKIKLSFSVCRHDGLLGPLPSYRSNLCMWTLCLDLAVQFYLWPRGQ